MSKKQFRSDVDVMSHMLVGSSGEIQRIIYIKQLVKTTRKPSFRLALSLRRGNV